MTADQLRAQLKEIEEGEQVARLQAELTAASSTIARLQATVSQQTKESKVFKDAIKTIQDALRGIDLKTRIHGPNNPAHAALTTAAAASARSYSAHVQAGIRHGTHDPATGLEYNTKSNPKPKDFTQAGTVVSKGDMEKIFPELALPPEDAASIPEA